MQDINVEETMSSKEEVEIKESNKTIAPFALNKHIQDMLTESMDYAIKENNAYFVIEVIKNMLEESNHTKDDNMVLELFEIIAKMANYNSDYTYLLLFKYDLLKSIFTSFGVIKKDKIILAPGNNKEMFMRKYNLKHLSVIDDSSYLQYFIDIVFKHYKQENEYFKTQDIKYSLLSARGVMHLCIKAIEGKYKTNNEQNIKNMLFLKQEELNITLDEFNLLYEKFKEANEKKFRDTIENILNNFSYYFFEQKIQVIEELIAKINSGGNIAGFSGFDAVPEENKEDIVKTIKSARNKILNSLKEIKPTDISLVEKKLESFKSEVLDILSNLSNKEDSVNVNTNEDIHSAEDIMQAISLLSKKLSTIEENSVEISEYVYSSKTVNDSESEVLIEQNNSPKNDNASEDAFLVITNQLASVKESVDEIKEYLSSSYPEESKSSETADAMGLLEAIESMKKGFSAQLSETTSALNEKIESFGEKIEFIYGEAKKSEEFRNSIKE